MQKRERDNQASRPSQSLLACRLTILVLVCLAVGCFSKKPPVTNNSSEHLTGDEKLIADLIQAEDLVLDLTPRLNELANWFEDPQAKLSSHLQSCRHTIPLADNLPTFRHDEGEPKFIEVANWTIDSATPQAGLNPWESLQKLDVQWTTMKFGVVSAHFTNESKTEFSLHTKVEARGESEKPEYYGMKGHQEIGFTMEDNGEWVLTKWIQEDLFVERSAQRVFREMLDETINDKVTLTNAQRSFKDEIVLRSAQFGRIMLPTPQHVPWTNLSSNHIFPSVSIVDFNNDGHDDLFLTARWGPTQMLQNQGDGSFTDVAEKIGLLQPNMVNCVLFVDIDNDGDKDAIMGRPMEPAKYFRNEDGQYVDATISHSDLGDQFFVTSIAASDVNRDGLLDVYLSNYAPLNRNGQNGAFEDIFLGDEERQRYLEKMKSSDRFLNLAGSANVLLMNRGGGKLERVPFDDVLSQWRRTFQSVWADVDNDGDDDLYICNDFAPDALLRNDTPQGASDPVFVDVTKQLLAGGAQGFGMGASWGDYDQDGDLDLYVSNMFSKAGNRIIGQVGSVDKRIEASAGGNFVFENQDGQYYQRAGGSDDQLHVNKVGWSFGGQWADFNNDGQLDVYVPSGYYTAPKEIDANVDT